MSYNNRRKETGAITVNILYLHSHDTGRNIEPYGYSVATPNLMRFAAESVVFRKAFCAAPTCSPSRSALVTGSCPHSNGMIGLAHRGFRMADYSRHVVTTLKNSGFHTALSGIQHVAESYETIGYDEYLGGRGPEIPSTEAGAESFLRSRPKTPFFLSVGFFETHRRFPDLQSEAEADMVRPPAPLPDSPQTRTDTARYARSAAILDEKMGRVLHALDESGLAEETLVIITTDHGVAFPGMKCNLNDNGTGVMLMMRGPDAFAGHRTIDAMVSQMDLFPTFCELLGIDPPSWLEGRSLMPLLRDDTERLHEALFAEVNYHGAYEPMRSVRTDRFRYVRRYDGRNRPVLPNCDDGESKSYLLENGWGARPPAGEALYDLVLDPYETNNIIADPRRREVIEDLKSRLQLWMEETRDPLLLGWVSAPSGAVVNDPDAPSPKAPTFRVP